VSELQPQECPTCGFCHEDHDFYGRCPLPEAGWKWKLLAVVMLLATAAIFLGIGDLYFTIHT
jgi:hypothetical protein